METSLNEPRESVHQVASRLRTYEDFNLASKLQSEEFDHHYAQNRCERRRMSYDLRQSKYQQSVEDQLAARHRTIQNNQIAERDEALARRLQQEFEREESLKRESQARLDAEFALRLQLNEESIQKKMVRKHSKTENEHDLHSRQQQQQHQKQQRQLIDATPFTNTVRRIEQSAKKVLPMLASVTPKIQFGTSKSSTGCLRKNSGRIATDCDTANSRWCDKIDERSQNELNLQMATASGIVEEQDALPFATRSDSFNRAAPRIGHRPLASTASLESRDTFVPSLHQTNSSFPSNQPIKSGNNPNSGPQSQISWQPSQTAINPVRSSPLIDDYHQQKQQIVSGDAPVSNDSNATSLCPTVISSGSKQLIPSQNMMSSSNAYVAAVSKIQSPVHSSTTLCTNLTPLQPSIPNRNGNVSLPPILNTMNITQANLLDSKKSIQSLNEIHHQSVPTTPLVHHQSLSIRPLTNQTSSINSVPSTPTLINNNYEANNTGYAPSNEAYPMNTTQLQMCNISFEANNRINESAENSLYLHPTNPFLLDVQSSLSSNQFTHSVLSPIPVVSCTKPIQSSQFIAPNQSNIQVSQILPPPSALALGLDMESTVRQQ